MRDRREHLLWLPCAHLTAMTYLRLESFTGRAQYNDVEAHFR